MVMDENRPYLTIFNEIRSTDDFDRLKEFKDPSLWPQMTSVERKLLSTLFLKHAEQLIYHGDSQVFSLFEISEQLAEQDPDVYSSQGAILLNYSQLSYQPKYLSFAKSKLEMAVQLSPANWQAWLKLASVFAQIGSAEEDDASFKLSQQTFEKVLELISEKEEGFDLLYWEWGKSLYLLGKYSGEVVDYKAALDKFQLAKEAGASSVSFWNDYALVLLQIAPLLNSAEALVKAIEFFAATVKEDSDYATGWFHLGCSLQQLYVILGHEELLLKANEYFRTSSNLDSENTETWYQWGMLLLTAARLQKQEPFFQDALDKLSIAALRWPSHVAVHCGLAEAYILQGAYEENFSSLQQARDQLIALLDEHQGNPDIWCTYGKCLYEFGNYFSDESYYYESIDKYQQGLALDNSNANLWHGLSEASLALGILQEDQMMLEKAAYFCHKAVKFKNNIPQYWFSWGNILMKLAELADQQRYVEEAIEKFNKAIQLRGGLEGYPDLQWIYQLGCAYDLLGEYKSDPVPYKKAAAYLSHVTEKEPECSPARYRLALAYYHLGEVTYELDYFTLSLEHFRALSEEDSEDELILNDWGQTLLSLAYIMHDSAHTRIDQQILEEGEQKLLQAAALGNPFAYYNLACCYSMMGHFEASIHFLQKAETNKALPTVEELMHDIWLADIRPTKEFQAFISHLRHRGS